MDLRWNFSLRLEEKLEYVSFHSCCVNLFFLEWRRTLYIWISKFVFYSVQKKSSSIYLFIFYKKSTKSCRNNYISRNILNRRCLFECGCVYGFGSIIWIYEFFSSIRRKAKKNTLLLLYKSFFPRVEEDVIYLDEISNL